MNKEKQRINAELERMRDAGITRKDISDGYHTFGELCYHRMILFSVILNKNAEIAWKARKHHDGTMFDGDFICGIETPQGQYTYHYGIEYWGLFRVKELEFAPEYDGHKPGDVVRLLSL
ncbi:WDGH domain-containing protein [Peptoniphilus sp. HCN-40583]|uniref:WDGH domain-containing protein n=1 Tax=Peptoniphilus sp. HCN-40583 TaxID=3134662 RepID=UPI0030C0F772